MRRRIVVLGPLPPPFGGVSIHIVRFLELLKSEGIRAKAYPYTGTTASGRLGKALQAARMLGAIHLRVRAGSDAVLHVHYGGLGYFLALTPILLSSRARLVATFHSVRVIQDLHGKPRWLRALVVNLLRRFQLFVVVREEIGAAVRDLGLHTTALSVMPAFLPPAPAELEVDRLPVGVREELVTAQQAGELQLCCAAYNLGRGYGHEDIYGVEELMAALVAVEPTIGRRIHLWVLVSNWPQGAEQVKAEARILSEAAGHRHLALHLHYGLPLVPVMCRTSAFLRPSREDGDSVAVREALAFGLPVLASDVVQRPKGVLTYGAGGLVPALSALLADLRPPASARTRAVETVTDGHYRSFVATVLGDSAAM